MNSLLCLTICMTLFKSSLASSISRSASAVSQIPTISWSRSSLSARSLPPYSQVSLSVKNAVMYCSTDSPSIWLRRLNFVLLKTVLHRTSLPPGHISSDLPPRCWSMKAHLQPPHPCSKARCTPGEALVLFASPKAILY